MGGSTPEIGVHRVGDPPKIPKMTQNRVKMCTKYAASSVVLLCTGVNLRTGSEVLKKHTKYHVSSAVLQFKGVNLGSGSEGLKMSSNYLAYKEALQFKGANL